MYIYKCGTTLFVCSARITIAIIYPISYVCVRIGSRQSGCTSVGCWPLVDHRADVRVLRLFVAPQVDLALERLVAQFAGERLVAGVLARVRDQVGALAERFAAHLALVGFFTCAGREK